MPKQLMKIDQFYGGLNSNADPRDIADNELAVASGVMVDSLGIIRPMGSTSTSGMPSAATVTINEGHGLFISSHDRDKAQDGTGTASTANPIRTDYLLMADTGGDAAIDIYSTNSGGTDWGTSIIDLGSASGMQPVIYSVDGNIRVYEGNFSLANVSKWYGYVRRDPYIEGNTGTTTCQSANNWVSGVALAAQGSTWDDVREQDSSNPATTSHYPTAADKIEFSSAFVGGSGISANFSMGVSTIYDGNQETGIFQLSTDTTTGDYIVASNEDVLNCYCFIRANGDGGSSYTWSNPRITGFNIYYREEETEIWYKQFHISMKSGIVDNEGIQFAGLLPTTWLNSAATTTHLYTFAQATYSTAIPFNISAGYSQDATTTSFQMKAAVVANRRVYAGNVKYTDATGNVVIKGDAVIKSPVNKFDIFPSDNIIEGSINDGDEITALASYADRLLIFKRKKMELLNISQEIEFLEDTFHYKGVLAPSSVCTTDFGIAWANKHGCYLYDGQRVTNIIEKKGRQIIDDITWANFADDEPMVGFVPRKRQIIVKRNSTNANDAGDIYLFDLVTQSWTFGTDRIPTADDTASTTNFAIDWNGDLILGYNTGTFAKWDDSSISQTIDIETKDFDFKQPGQRKNVYKVYVTYTGGTSQSCNIQYKKNGAGSWLEFDANMDDTTGNQVQATFTPSASISDINSLQLKISGTAASTFELNDMSISFRTKVIL